MLLKLLLLLLMLLLMLLLLQPLLLKLPPDSGRIVEAIDAKAASGGAVRDDHLGR